MYFKASDSGMKAITLYVKVIKYYNFNNLNIGFL